MARASLFLLIIIASGPKIQHDDLTSQILIVNIQEENIQLIAKTITIIESCRPKSILIDALFEQSTTQQNDEALINAFCGNDSLILGMRHNNASIQAPHPTFDRCIKWKDITNMDQAINRVEQILTFQDFLVIDTDRYEVFHWKRSPRPWLLSRPHSLPTR